MALVKIARIVGRLEGETLPKELMDAGYTAAWCEVEGEYDGAYDGPGPGTVPLILNPKPNRYLVGFNGEFRIGVGGLDLLPTTRPLPEGTTLEQAVQAAEEMLEDAKNWKDYD